MSWNKRQAKLAWRKRARAFRRTWGRIRYDRTGEGWASYGKVKSFTISGVECTDLTYTDFRKDVLG